MALDCATWRSISSTESQARRRRRRCRAHWRSPRSTPRSRARCGRAASSTAMRQSLGGRAASAREIQPSSASVASTSVGKVRDLGGDLLLALARAHAASSLTVLVEFLVVPHRGLEHRDRARERADLVAPAAIGTRPRRAPSATASVTRVIARERPHQGAPDHDGADHRKQQRNSAQERSCIRRSPSMPRVDRGIETLGRAANRSAPSARDRLVSAGAHRRSLVESRQRTADCGSTPRERRVAARIPGNRLSRSAKAAELRRVVRGACPAASSVTASPSRSLIAIRPLGDRRLRRRMDRTPGERARIHHHRVNQRVDPLDCLRAVETRLGIPRSSRHMLARMTDGHHASATVTVASSAKIA